MTLFLIALIIVSGLVALWREFAAIDKSLRFAAPDEAISNLGDRWVGIFAAVAGVVIFLDML